MYVRRFHASDLRGRRRLQRAEARRNEVALDARPCCQHAAGHHTRLRQAEHAWGGAQAMTTPTTKQQLGGSLSVPEAMARKETEHHRLVEWRGRHDDVAARLTAARARAEGLAVQAAAATLDGGDPKGARRERAAVLVEIEELELALTMA